MCIFALPEFIWLSLQFTDKQHKRDKSAQFHSHLGTARRKNRREKKKPGKAHLTDEYTHACGHLAGAQRITGRGSGTSSSRPTTGKSLCESDEDDAFI